MNKFFIAAMVAASFVLSSSHFHEHHLCHGFVPENDLYIPVGDFNALGIEEAEFHAVLDRIEEVYAPIIREHGGVLNVNRRWSDGTVNASANRSGRTFHINMYGGLARHEEVTADGFAIVACHELGHHIGGAPKYSRWFGSWASNEGQSDYFASLKCMRRLFTDAENIAWAETHEIDPIAAQKCNEAFSSDGDRAVCMRSAMAAWSVSLLFRQLRDQEEYPAFGTPDPAEVARTSDGHPDTQCRLDTYFNGALCTEAIDAGVDQGDAVAGTCNRSEGDQMGVRPRCWYKPAATITSL